MPQNFTPATFTGNNETAQNKKGNFVRFMNYKFEQKSDPKKTKYNVPLNIIEKDNQFEIHVFATGFSKEDIKITVTDDILFIKGSKEIDDENVPKFSRQEFPIKNFERKLSLNASVETQNFTAFNENGVLIINLPKTKKKYIEVK